jgi:aerobic-type carbon monoxide dehydrogenase small subunit (CoxS/CutS family)
MLHLNVNGRDEVIDVPDHALLSEVVRDHLGLTGTKMSCGVQVCGACTVLVDDQPVSSCCYLACDATDRKVTTIEGLTADPRMQEIADAFLHHAATQCGFCTPGFLLTLWSLCRDGRELDEETVRHELIGNLCRCTGYKAIVDAAVEVAVRGR